MKKKFETPQLLTSHWIGISNILTKKSSVSNNFTAEYYQIFKEEFASIFKLFQKVEDKGTLLDSFYEYCVSL